ncbi:MAG: sugar-transporting ATPase [Planctomycetaceae bacterium]|nr:sugar-transporting ATPase [Planctomycetaceae bacterium]
MKRLFSEYGSVVVFLLLCGYYSVVTWSEQHPTTAAAGRAMARLIVATHGADSDTLIVVRDTMADRVFAAAIAGELERSGGRVRETVFAKAPVDAGRALRRIGSGEPLQAVATHHAGTQWGPLKADRLARLAGQFSSLRATRVYAPESYMWPSFLTWSNLLNVFKNNADIAIIAIGMTMVIITAGIDLSVGSLLALSGVITAVMIQRLWGGAHASLGGLVAGCLIGAGICALGGTLNGIMVTVCHIPAFVVTLAMMMVARGLALIIAVDYQSFLSGGGAKGTPEAVKIDHEAFGSFSNGELLGIPNPILLTLLLYLLAHVLMTSTPLGRYIYAVGGNREAARLSGVPVMVVLIFVYTLCGAFAGLSGVMDASRFEGGRPNAGELYELRVIAAVVVGGTSLAGGEGRIFGTLVGAGIIAIIQNGLNMQGVATYEQMVVFGSLILAAAMVDQLKKSVWGLRLLMLPQRLLTRVLRGRTRRG